MMSCIETQPVARIYYGLGAELRNQLPRVGRDWRPSIQPWQSVTNQGAGPERELEMIS